MTISTKQRAENQAGFTLIELAVVMVIIGILISAIVPIYENYYRTAQVKELESNVKEVRVALGEFRGARTDTNGDGVINNSDNPRNNLPCPAPRNAGIGTANFGRATCPTGGVGTCTDGVCVVAGTGGQRVFIGSVPTSTLEIPGALALDPYGNRLTYAVSANLTAPGGMPNVDDPGAIRVVTESLDPTNPGGPLQVSTTDNSAFALVSHGRDGAGSWTPEGLANSRGCRAGDDGDNENCDGDATFRSVARETNADVGTFYDDTAAFTFGDTGGDGDQWWRETSPGSGQIVNKNSGNVGIGVNPVTGGPRLDVEGVIQARTNVIAKNDVTAEKNVVAKDSVTAEKNVIAKDSVTAEKNITTSSGNIVATAGNVSAVGGSVTAKSNIESTTGNVVANKNLTAGNDVVAANKISARGFFYTGAAPVGGGGTPTTMVPASTINAACASGYVLQSISSGTPVCVKKGPDVVNVTCPSGQFVNKIVNGVATCAAAN